MCTVIYLGLEVNLVDNNNYYGPADLLLKNSGVTRGTAPGDTL